MSTAPVSPFIPPDLDAADFARLEPFYRQLLDRTIDTPVQLQRLLADWSQLAAAVSECGARRRIDQSCHTDDAAIEGRFLAFIREVEPRVKPLVFELQKKVVGSPHAAALGPDLATLLRDWRAEVALYRPANVPLETAVQEAATRYDKLIGAMTIDHDGQTLTLQQAGRYLEEPDRAVRESVWHKLSQRRLADRAAIEDVFDELLDLRRRIAANADQPDYRGYAWQSMCRFDYTPEDCQRFGAAIERACVPRAAQLAQRRRAALGVDALRPWDLAVDPQNRPPLRPFPGDDVGKLLSGTSAALTQIDPQLAAQFGKLRMGRNLDLESRRGKRAGGYQSSLEVVREPFIFMNAAGMQRDVETLLHEAGHAFHYQWSSAANELVFVRHAPIEFCEVASMSLELLAADHFGQFYGSAAEAGRAKRTLLEGIIKFFPWMATIDGFQHFLYTHEGHTRAQRAAAWEELQRRFATPGVDWSGHEDEKAALWQRQIHLFHYPFYYVEYGIAQLGALQLWLQYRTDPGAALDGYRRALTLGGTRPLPELFAAAGVRFDFSAATLEPLMAALEAELASLPE